MGQATEPPTATKFQESPVLAAMVQAGSLPALAERLPSKPLVIAHKWLRPGKYGGQMRMGGAGTDAFATSGYVHESMYGHSLLRFLRDGLEIGPGLVETWGPNKDQSEWTLKLREGLKWSDGKAMTTADILYWWEDMVLNEEHPETPPDDMRSGKGTIGKLTAEDDVTFKMTFDAPAPITPERLAAWVNRGIGPQWIVPKHYMQQFHPKYNKALAGNKAWFEGHDNKLSFDQTPENPVMTGWKLKSIKVGQSSVWDRNPYYWCVDTAGNQLPYIDGLTFTTYQDPEVMKLNFQNGNVDYVHGGHTPLGIADYSGLKESQERSKLELRLWDSGSGTASIFFFNFDFPEPKMRALIRNPKFRQALSHAYNRAEVQKVVYYGTGELTTGTLSGKGFNFNVNEEGQKRYVEWRDSYIKYDPEMAKKMLDELGVVDKNNDGLREMPDGSRLTITLDYPADESKEHISKNTLLSKHWRAVGIEAKLNPVPPTSWNDRWGRGLQMSTTAWEVGDNSPLIYPGWVVPVEPAHWAPLHGKHFQSIGTPDENSQANVDPWKRQPPRIGPNDKAAFYEPVARLWKLYGQARIETNPTTRLQREWDIFKIHVNEGPYFLGAVANWPRSVLVKQGLMNVPTQADLKKYALGGWVNPWILPSPAVYDPETYYWETPPA
ncbi:MAG: ABC transporter substrate-binding protein [Chloroflexia bacterium]